MADSLKQRLSDLEPLGRPREDLRGYFASDDEAGADARVDRLMVRLQALEAETQSTLVSISTQIVELEDKLGDLRRRRDELLNGLPLTP